MQTMNELKISALRKGHKIIITVDITGDTLAYNLLQMSAHCREP